MADVPNADPVCLLHDSQWHMYRARGCGIGVWKRTAPHWHEAFIVRDDVWLPGVQRKLCNRR